MSRFILYDTTLSQPFPFIFDFSLHAVVRRYPVFLGRPHRSSPRQEPLHIQRVLQVNRTLYIGAR